MVRTRLRWRSLQGALVNVCRGARLLTHDTACNSHFQRPPYIEGMLNPQKESPVLKTRYLLAVTTMASAFALGGCASAPTHNQLGTAAGAVAGGVAGHVLFGGPLGTVGGAAAGAVIGNELTKSKRR